MRYFHFCLSEKGMTRLIQKSWGWGQRVEGHGRKQHYVNIKENGCFRKVSEALFPHKIFYLWIKIVALLPLPTEQAGMVADPGWGNHLQGSGKGLQTALPKEKKQSLQGAHGACCPCPAREPQEALSPVPGPQAAGAPACQQEVLWTKCDIGLKLGSWWYWKRRGALLAIFVGCKGTTPLLWVPVCKKPAFPLRTVPQAKHTVGDPRSFSV